MYEEVLKSLLCRQSLSQLRTDAEYKLFAPLFPQVAALLKNDPKGDPKMVQNHHEEHRSKVNEDKPVTPSFFYAALLGIHCVNAPKILPLKVA